MDALERLVPLLARLEEAVAARPGVADRFRPGLSVSEIERQAAALAPFRLPGELVALYQWHDGFDQWGDGGSPIELFADAFFPSLTEALDTYRLCIDIAEELNGGWCPAWFPAFGSSQFGEFITLAPRSGPAAELLWRYHNTDPNVTAQYDSIESLITTTTRLWEDGFRPLDQDRDRYKAMLAMISESNPECFVTPGEWLGRRHESSCFLDDSWLPEWKAAAGYERETGPLPDPTPIAQLDIGALSEPAAIQGVLHWLGCGDDWGAGEVRDSTGSVRVGLTKTLTENYEQTRLGDQLMLWVIPNHTDPAAMDRSPDDLSGAAQDLIIRLTSPPLAAVKIVPVYNQSPE